MASSVARLSSSGHLLRLRRCATAHSWACIRCGMLRESDGVREIQVDCVGAWASLVVRSCPSVITFQPQPQRARHAQLLVALGARSTQTLHGCFQSTEAAESRTSRSRDVHTGG